MILDEIVSIKKVGVRKTIDIEVDGPDHYFYCNGILLHNSAAGDTNDITEENIQGGISKIQAADNVIGFVPNAQARATGIMRAKFLKTRDSGGVGSYVDFKTDWSTLSFNPWSNEDGGGADNAQTHAYSNLPSQQKEYTRKEKPSIKRNSEKPSVKVKSNDNDISDDEETKSATSVIRGIKGRNKPHQKKIKLL